MIMENYIYRAALPHQIQFFSYGYEWGKKPTAESFARDFIKTEYSAWKEEVPESILKMVIESVQNVIPAVQFSGVDHA